MDSSATNGPGIHAESTGRHVDNGGCEVHLKRGGDNKGVKWNQG